MKLNKKKVFALALAVCLIATLSMGSLAWFTAEDQVTNDFLIGDTNTTPDKVFGIDLWEETDADRDGTSETVGKDVGNDIGAKYETILPGEILPKKPYLTNTGIHPQFVRAIVTVTPASILKDAMGDDWKNADLFLAGTDATKWQLDSISYTNEGTTSKLVYVYYYQEELAAGATTDDIFEAVVVPTGLTTDQAAQMGGFQINIVGQAIQSEHILKDNAKDAFETYWQGVPAYNPSAAEVAFVNANITTPLAPEVSSSFTSVYIEDSEATGEALLKVVDPVYQVQIINVTADVEDFVIIEHESTVVIAYCNITLPAGGKLVVNNSNSLTSQVVIYGDVYVNGELLTNANIGQYLDAGMTYFFA